MRTKAYTILGTLVLTAGLASAPGTAVAAGASATAVSKISHSTATTMFRNAGIGWTSSGGCSDRNVSTCTSFEQLNLATAQGAVTLRNASGCAMTITGGTETGHASGTYSHWNGYKLDYSLTTCLGNYITGSFSRIANRSDGAAQYKSGSGNIYALEGNHWDVTYYNCGGC
ncbi:hypothetical protein [Streptomyces sp. NPDC056600]|uniref:hypothetical protein n=1 Tax=Streptomyces sp. NPDC056600 TaxID=3345874 RepID=UPI00368E7435